VFFETNDCLRGDGGLRVAMRPEPEALVVLPAGQEGRTIRAVTVAGYNVQGVGDFETCLTARGFRDAEHPRSTLDDPLPMTSRPRGRIYFTTATGDVLDDGGQPQGTFGCGDPFPAPLVDATARPRHGAWYGPSTTFLELSATVPPGAVLVGVLWDLPSIPGWIFPESVLTTTTFELEAWVDPAVVPGASPAATDPNWTALLPYAIDPALPRSCGDPRWFTVSDERAWENRADANVSDCYAGFAELIP
jgi:hypothetical protein